MLSNPSSQHKNYQIDWLVGIKTGNQISLSVLPTNPGLGSSILVVRASNPSSIMLYLSPKSVCSKPVHLWSVSYLWLPPLNGTNPWCLSPHNKVWLFSLVGGEELLQIVCRNIKLFAFAFDYELGDFANDALNCSF